MPTTKAQFNQLVQQLRRYGHVTEGTHGNTAAALQGPLRQARPNDYYAEHQAKQVERISPLGWGRVPEFLLVFAVSGRFPSVPAGFPTCPALF